MSGAVILRKSVLVLSIVAITLVASELIFRAVLLSNLGIGKRFRKPSLYFDYFTDDRFWEANYLFGKFYGDPGQRTHPLIGWPSERFTDTFELRNPVAPAGRRPVLLYGDSFASCSDSLPRCFETYLNEDTRFSGKCYFLNYAVGAHGVDQTYLTFKNSVGLYQNPIVVYSLMTMDLDRAVLHVFIKQKPYFTLSGDELIPSTEAIDPDVAHYFATHQPRVRSYLYRLFYRKLTGRNSMATDPARRPLVQRLGARILRQAIADLRSRHLDVLFVVFVPNWVSESYVLQRDDDDWRLMTILDVLRAEGVPYIVTKDLLKPMLASRPQAIEQLFLGDGHPSEEQNRIIAEAIRQRLSPCLP